VLAVVVAGTTGFAAMHKTVVLEVDGQVSTVSVYGRTVEDVLAAQGVTVDPRDVVLPSLASTVAHDSQIVVRHWREVAVEVDGASRTVWTAAETVGDLVAELGLRDARTSSSRSAALGRDALRLSTVKSVTLGVDGSTLELSTAGSTVREVLRDAGVVLGDHDLVSVPLDAVAVDGLVIQVTRVETVIASETVPAPFSEVREDDPGLAKGTEVVATAGRDGTRVVTFESYRAAGAEIGRDVIAESVLREPVNRVVRVGTREGAAVPSGPAVEPGTARAIGRDMVLARGWGEDQWSCLDALWSRESGWRTNASNGSSGAYGIPQALPGSKMASAGADWQTNPATQITWGLGYITGRYGTPCGAWDFFSARRWY
jgi:uncharacterized protein YabE (DUF348 family)